MGRPVCIIQTPSRIDGICMSVLRNSCTRQEPLVPFTQSMAPSFYNLIRPGVLKNIHFTYGNNRLDVSNCIETGRRNTQSCTRHNSADSVSTSNLVCIKEVAIRTTFSHMVNIAGIIYYNCSLLIDIKCTRYTNAFKRRPKLC